jgi:hypothetical protein
MADQPDPEQLVGDLPRESPPPEIVLAAVRVFRYRALIVLVLVAALSTIGVLVADRFLGPVSTDDVVAAARHSGGTTTLALEQDVGDVRVLFWEIVSSSGAPAKGFAHILAWGHAGSAFQVRMTKLVIGGQQVSFAELGSLGSCCPAYFESWVQFQAPDGVGPPIAADVEVVQASSSGALSVLATAHLETEGEQS